MHKRAIFFFFFFLLTHTVLVGKNRVYVTDTLIKVDSWNACMQERWNYLNIGADTIVVGKTAVPAYRVGACSDSATGMFCECPNSQGQCSDMFHCDD